MILWKQIIGFLIGLALLLSGQQFFCEIFKALPQAQAYGGIDLFGEGDYPLKLLWGGDTSGVSGVGTIGNAIYAVVQTIKYIVYIVALVYIVVAGLRIITAGWESTIIKNNKDTIVFALFGFMVMLLADTAVKYVLYGWAGGGEVWPAECLANPGKCSARGAQELMGIVYWGKSILALIAVIEIITSGVRMIMAVGEKDIIDKEKKVFIWVGLGLLILAINQVIIDNVLYIIVGEDKVEQGLKYSPNWSTAVDEFVGVIQFILQFVAIFAFVAMIYGGFMYLMGIGDNKNVETAKTVIKDAVIGIIIALCAYALIATFVIQQN